MTPLVLVHGFLGGSQQWSAQVQALRGHCEIVTVDLPGFGENAQLGPINRISDFAQWVLEDLTRRDISRFHLLGHSMGGMIAQEMISLAPDYIDHLVLYGTGATGVLPGRFETIGMSKDRAKSEGAQATARRIAATWFLNRETDPEYRQCAAIAECSTLPAILSGLDAMEAWDGTRRLSDISAPTLIIWGDQDRTYSWAQTEMLWRSIKNARLAVLPDCAHAVHLENPQLFNSIVAGFLCR